MSETIESARPLFRIVIPRVPCLNVFSHIIMPPLGALYVAASVKESSDWDVEVIDELNWRSQVSRRELALDSTADHRDLQSRRPAQAVGFYGGLSSTVPRLFKLVKFYKSLGLPTVTGGAHVDALPEEALSEGVDIVVHGEGEETIGEILAAWTGSGSLDNISGISFLSGDGSVINTGPPRTICDLDSLPRPDLKLLVESRRPHRVAPFERTRGCNYKCEFCIVNDRFGACRSASAERVASDVETLVKNGFQNFFCVDDNFTHDRIETLRLLALFRDIGERYDTRLRITVQVRSSVGRDEELMRAMRSAGVRILAIGLESPIEEELEGMSKKQTPKMIERDVKNIHRHGFRIHGMFIFGYPLENEALSLKLTMRERADKYISFIRRTAIDTIQVLKPVPIPGSRLAERLREQGRIFPLKLVGWDKYDGNFLTFLPTNGISAKELQEQANRIMRRFYSPFRFLDFPLLVFTTPVDIPRIWSQRASEFARDRADRTQAALSGSVERISAFHAGFNAAMNHVVRTWRNAFVRTLGSVIVTSWHKTSRNDRFLTVLTQIQASMKKKEKDKIRISRA